MAETETRESETSTGRSGSGSGLSKKWHGLPIWAWTVGGTVVAVVGYKWWKGRGAASAGSTTSASTTTSTQGCYDSAGNPVPCTSSQYGQLLTALQDMYGSTSSATTSTGTSTGGGEGTSVTTTPSSEGVCKPGYHFVSSAGLPVGAGTMMVGTYRVTGGYCVPDSTGSPVPPPPPRGGSGSPPPKPKQRYKYVRVVRWTPGKTAWNSTLSGIAHHENTTVGELLKLNPSVKNPNIIHVGQRIKVPYKA